MSVSLPAPSSRLLRAASAEQAELARHRDRLAAQRGKLVAELSRIDEGIAAVDERLRMLEQLTEAPPPAQPGTTTPAPDASLIRGPAVREVAVQVLLRQPQHVEALHYRRWYELLLQAGYKVAGKDPLAVFLTQITRSPVVRKAGEPGVYEVDRQAPLRIRQRLERLHTEMREVAVSPSEPVQLTAVRARRHELDLEISQHERALEEALRVLRRDQAGVPSTGVTNLR